MIEGTVSLKCSRCNHCEVCQWVDLKMNGCDWFEEEPRTGWIPCSERLPEAGEYVGDVAKYYLVQNEYGDMLVARYTHSGHWRQMYQLELIDDEIVAWMPLPQKYKEEGSDKDEQG